jgi:hypothetical protein
MEIANSSRLAEFENHEDLEGAMTAFMSNLKLPAAGFRSGVLFSKMARVITGQLLPVTLMPMCYSLAITRILQRFRRHIVGRVIVAAVSKIDN